MTPNVAPETPLLHELIARARSVALFAVPADAPADWKHLPLTRELTAALRDPLPNRETLELRDHLQGLLGSQQAATELAQQNDLLIAHIDQMLASVVERQMDETGIATMFDFVGPNVSYAVIRHGSVLYNRGIDQHSVTVETRRMQLSSEHSCPISNGERFVLQSEPYIAIIDSPERIGFVAKQLIRLSLTQLGAQFRQRELHEMIERLYSMFTGGASTPHGPGPTDSSRLGAVEDRFVEVLDATLRDSLTQTYNRTKTEQVMSTLCASGQPFAAVLADIDHFKQVNDDFGHLEGDRVIVEVASALEDGRRSNDVVARWGGEEFLVLLPDSDVSTAAEVAEKMRCRIESTIRVGDRHVTASFGVAAHRVGESPDGLFERADSALYAAKHAGRNTVFSDGLG